MLGPIHCGWVLLLVLLLPAMALADETILWEDFDEVEGLNDLRANWVTNQHPAGTLSVRDGFLFMNFSQEEYSPGFGGEALLITPKDKLFSFLVLEVTLRCSSDNRLESDVGGGSRAWGFARKIPAESAPHGIGWFQLGFLSISSDTDWAPAGFGVLSMAADQALFYQPIQNVDIREWHDYTVLWRPGNGTFLVDGVTVATTANVPEEAMRAYCDMDIDMMQGGSWVQEHITFLCETSSLEEACTDEFIQIDHIRVFMEAERVQEMEQEVSGLLSDALQLIDELEERGENTTQLRVDYGESQDNWQKNHFFYEEDLQHLEAMIGAMVHWDEVLPMFAEAGEAIKALEREGKTREAMIATGDYSRAEAAWAEYDHDTTKMYLQKVVDKAAEIPETALLLLFGLILLPRFLRRR